ncbi:MAG TPA: metal-sulfur cluster assembly factor [Gemmatimonadaceae bacterium]|nr:metal-sulfur cluster assembly factor [Gemmatimonadaceae bacterium]
MDTEPLPATPTLTPLPASPTAADTVSTSAPSIDQIKLALRRVKDPDLNLNIVDLGLVYDVRVDNAVVTVDITLTSPACPSGPEIITSIDREITAIPGVNQVQVNLIWTPFWTPDRIEPRVRAYLGL